MEIVRKNLETIGNVQLRKLADGEIVLTDNCAVLEGVVSVEDLVVILLWRLQIASLFIFAREYDLITSPNIYNVQSVLAINELALMNWIPHRHRTLHL